MLDIPHRINIGHIFALATLQRYVWGKRFTGHENDVFGVDFTKSIAILLLKPYVRFERLAPCGLHRR